MEDLPPNLPEDLVAGIVASALTGLRWIHANKLKGADTDLCLEQAYNVWAQALIVSPVELNDAALHDVIPSFVVKIAKLGKWLPPDSPYHSHENLMKCLSSRMTHWQKQALLLRDFEATIREGVLKIHAKKLEGADTDLWREAYDVLATAMRDFDQELNDVVIRRVIPAWILRYYGDDYLAAVPRQQRYENLMERVRGSIVYWQITEALRQTEKQKGRSPWLGRWEALQELKRLRDGPHEKIPEDFVRITLAQRCGIKPEEVTREQIRLEIIRLSPSAGYQAVELVPPVPETDDDQKRFLYHLPAGTVNALRDHLSAFLASYFSASDESSPLDELDASDELQRWADDPLDKYRLDPCCPPTALSESHKSETMGENETPKLGGGTAPEVEDAVAEQPVSDAESIKASERHALVDSFLLSCKQEVPLNVTKKRIWLAVGHKSPRQFQYWQAGDDRLPGASRGATGVDDKNFRRILAMQPADFVRLLKKKGIV